MKNLFGSFIVSIFLLVSVPVSYAGIVTLTPNRLTDLLGDSPNCVGRFNDYEYE